MAHTPDCPADDSAPRLKAWARKHWPKGQPQEVDVATLGAAGTITNPLRIPEATFEHPWLLVWGNFQGLRWGISSGESFQIFPGTAVPYPFGVDLYLSADTGGSGTASFAVFTTRDAAIAFAGSRPSAGGKIIPGTASFTPSDTQANPTGLSGVESFQMVWDIADSFWVRWEARSPSDALPLRNIPEVIAEGALFDSVNNVFVRARQIASAAATGRAAVEDSYKNGTVQASMSMASTGVKLTYTCPAGKVATTQGITIVTTSGSLSTGQWQILLNGNVIMTLAVGAILDSLNQGFGVVMSAGDVLTINVATLQAGITAQGYIFVQERYAE